MDNIKKRNVVIVVVAVIVAIVIGLGVTYIVLNDWQHKHDPVNLDEYARKYFGMETLLFYSRQTMGLNGFQKDGKTIGSDDFPIADCSPSYYYYYVVGLKDGKEVAGLIPYYEEEVHWQTNWIFDTSFTEVLNIITSQYDSSYEIPERKMLQIINYVGDMKDYVGNIDDIQLDVSFMLILGDYAIVQSGGEILVFNIENA